MIPSLIFDPVTHTYIPSDGGAADGVSAVLRQTGVSADFELIGATSPVLRAQIKSRRVLGTLVHALTQAFDEDDLVLASVHASLQPWLHAWRAFREDTRLRPVVRECIVFHPKHRYAGRLDGIFEDPRGRLILVDVKTGDPESSGTQYQTAAYAAAQTVGIIAERWAVQLAPDLKVPYRIHNYSVRPDAWQDFDLFLCFLATYRHQVSRREKA